MKQTRITLTNETRDFRRYLQSELVGRIQRNPKYSVRAFARVLGVESSALSKILRGKRTVSGPMLRKMGVRLGLSPSSLKSFESSLKESRGRKAEFRGEPAKPAPDYATLAEELFQAISDWYHFAILELTSISGFKSDLKWIANKLGISVAEVNVAVERLERIDFLDRSNPAHWVDRSGAVTTAGNEFTTQAFKKLQIQILQKAIEAIEEVDISKRDQSAMTMAIDSSLIPEAKVKIKKFRRELCEFLQSSGVKNSVFHLGVSLYPVTKESV